VTALLWVGGFIILGLAGALGMVVYVVKASQFVIEKELDNKEN
jgi:hypothetical protein